MIVHTTPSMRLIAAEWNKEPSFKLLPVFSACPYVEMFYAPDSKTLVVISKEHKRGFQMISRLDDTGKPIPLPGRDAQGFRQQRVEFDAYYEYYLTNPQDIRELVEQFAINPDHHSFRAFFPQLHSREIPTENLGYQGNGATAQPNYNTDIEPNKRIKSDPEVEVALDPENAPDEPARGVTDNPDVDVSQEELLKNVEQNKDIFAQQMDFVETVATVDNNILSGDLPLTEETGIDHTQDGEQVPNAWGGYHKLSTN